MRRYTKAISYFLVAILFSVALSGCTKKTTTTDSNSNKVIVWSFESEDTWKPIKKAFEENYKGYELVYYKHALDANYENDVLNSILSGQGPDVWSMPNDSVYRHKDQLAPMLAKMKANYNLDELFVPVVKQSVLFNDNIYALTPSAQPLMVFYNEKLFDQALDRYDDTYPGDENTAKRDRASDILSSFPKTWDDFTEAVKILTLKNGDNIEISGASLGTDKTMNAKDLLYLLMLQNGTQIVSDNLKLATFNLPKDTPKSTQDLPGKRALDYFTSFADPTNANYTWNDSLGDSATAFANGKTAMVFAYSELEDQLSQKYPNFTYKRAFVPQFSTEQAQIVDYAKFNAFGVSALSTKADVSWGLIDTLVSDVSGEYNSALSLYTADKSDNYETGIDARSSDNPEKQSLSTAKTVNKGRYPAEFDKIIKDTIFSVNNKIQDSKVALDLAAENATKLLIKENW